MNDPGASASLTADARALPEFPMHRSCPYQPPADYARFPAERPLTRAQLFDGRSVWLVLGHELARALYTDARLSSDRRNPDFPLLSPRRASLNAQRALIGMDPPEHTGYRRMVMSGFTHKRIRAMRPFIERQADERIDAMLAAGPPCDLMSSLALPVSSAVICELLGVPYGDHERFERQSLRLLEATTADEGASAVTALREYLAGLIDAKHSMPGDGLLDVLLAERVGDRSLDVEDLVTVSLVLLVAGHETTASMITLGTLVLLDNPEQLALLRADPELVGSAVEELLRYLSVADIVSRVAVDDIEVGDDRIVAGDGVLLTNSAINRDPTVYERPDELDVRRAPRHHTAFGYGVHQCIGHNLARAELDVVFRRTLTRLPTLAAAIGTDELRIKGPFGPQGVFALPVTW